MSSLRRSHSSSNLSSIEHLTNYTIKYRTPIPGFGLHRSSSHPELSDRYKPRNNPTAYRVKDGWNDYWWERRHYGGQRYWPHYGFPYRRFWHQKSLTSTLACYPSLSWTSRFSQYDQLDPISWRRYREPLAKVSRWGPYLDSRFELRLSVFDSSAKQYSSSSNYYVKPYQPRIWFPMPSCWPYSYHYSR